MSEVRKLAAEAKAEVEKLAAEAEAEVHKLEGDVPAEPSVEPVPGERQDVTVTPGVASASGSVTPDSEE
jgi:hypothetical protein